MITINKKPVAATGVTVENEPIIKSDGAGEVMQWQPSDGTANGVFVREQGNVLNLGIGVQTPGSMLSVSPIRYNTGTASQSGTTVTGSGTTWTAAMVGGQFVYADGTTSGAITARASNTSITVTTSQTVASQTYGIHYTGLQVSSAGNVGVGIALPTSAYGRTVHINNSGGSGSSLHLTDSTSGSANADGFELASYAGDAYVLNREAGNLYLGTSGATKLTIDSAGKVTLTNILALSTDTTPDTSGGEAMVYKHSSNGAVLSGYSATIETGSAGSRTAKMTISSAGTTWASADGFASAYHSGADAAFATINAGATRPGIRLYNTDTGSASQNAISFKRNTTEVGTITTTNTATAFNTSSDYRLKENVTALTGALDRLDSIPVYNFNFKTDPTKTVDGFLAHEVSEFVPEAIHGTKDEMQTVVTTEAVEAVEAVAATLYVEGDELPEGKSIGDEKTPAVEAVDAVAEVTEEQPKYQGIDQSKLVPLMLAAIKELKAKVTALESA